MLEFIRDAYDVFAQLGLSITGLIIASVLLAFAFLFSVREAASWFFKIDDVKRDIVRLREITALLEGEIRALHSQVVAVAKTSVVSRPQAKKANSAPSGPTLPIPSLKFPLS